MKTISAKTQKQLVNDYILNAIDGEAYGKELTTNEEKLNFVADCFVNEFCYANNLKQYGSYQRVFAEWIQGLPSVFNIAFYNDDILELAVKFGSLPVDYTEKDADKILSNWWNWIAAKTFSLFSKYGVNAFRTKG